MPGKALLSLAILCAFPAMAWSASPACPDLNEVLARVSPPAPALDAEKLVSEAGAVALDSQKLAAFEAEVEAHVPKAPQADVIDILIASYCRYLEEQHSGVDMSESVDQFEKAVYETIQNTDRVTPPPHDLGWLYSD